MTLRDEFDQHKADADFKKMIDKKYRELDELEDEYYQRLVEIAKYNWKKAVEDEAEEDYIKKMQDAAESWSLEIGANFEIKEMREELKRLMKEERDEWWWFILLLIILPEMPRQNQSRSFYQSAKNKLSNKLQQAMETPPAAPDIGMGM